MRRLEDWNEARNIVMPASARISTVFRPARPNETPLLHNLHVSSLCCVGMSRHSPEAIEGFVRAFPSVDRELIAREAYFVAERDGEIVAACGWSPARDSFDASLFVDPVEAMACASAEPQAALLRAFFVLPHVAHEGIGRRIVQHAEADAMRAGHAVSVMFAAGSCAGFYMGLGYRELQTLRLDLGQGRAMPVLRLKKRLAAPLAAVA